MSKSRKPATAKAETKRVKPQSRLNRLGLSGNFSELIARLKFLEADWTYNVALGISSTIYGVDSYGGEMREIERDLAQLTPGSFKEIEEAMDLCRWKIAALRWDRRQGNDGDKTAA